MKFSLALYEVEHLFILFSHLNILSYEKLLKDHILCPYLYQVFSLDLFAEKFNVYYRYYIINTRHIIKISSLTVLLLFPSQGYYLMNRNSSDCFIFFIANTAFILRNSLLS